MFHWMLKLEGLGIFLVGGGGILGWAGVDEGLRKGCFSLNPDVQWVRFYFCFLFCLYSFPPLRKKDKSIYI